MVPVANLSSLTSFGWKGIKRGVREPERDQKKREHVRMKEGERRGRRLIDKTDKPV